MILSIFDQTNYIYVTVRRQYCVDDLHFFSYIQYKTQMAYAYK